jgi:site-specific recombinase XerD
VGRRKKTGTMYKVPLSKEAISIMFDHGGLEYLPTNIEKNGCILNMLMRLAGIEKTIKFHTARKTFANYLINEKMVNPTHVILMMGWKRIEESLPYARVKESTLHRSLFN